MFWSKTAAAPSCAYRGQAPACVVHSPRPDDNAHPASIAFFKRPRTDRSTHVDHGTDCDPPRCDPFQHERSAHRNERELLVIAEILNDSTNDPFYHVCTLYMESRYLSVTHGRYLSRLPNNVQHFKLPSHHKGVPRSRFSS